MTKKYELKREDTITTDCGKTLYRIVAVRSFGRVLLGELGGYVEHDLNLSHHGECWIYGDAKVFGYARVCDNVKVCDNAQVYEHAVLTDDVIVRGSAKVFGKARIHDKVQAWGTVCGNARLRGEGEVYGGVTISSESDESAEPPPVSFEEALKYTEEGYEAVCAGTSFGIRTDGAVIDVSRNPTRVLFTREELAVFLGDNWKLEQKPISFQEAVQVVMGGGRVSLVGGDGAIFGLNYEKDEALDLRSGWFAREWVIVD
jgi:hypothetical protein